MTDPKLPDFLADEPTPAAGTEFEPQQGRRGEWVAWASALALALLIALQTQLSGGTSTIVIVFFAVVFAAALMVTYANWMERNTTIAITASGVKYTSPVRKTELRWSQIEEVWLVPSRSAWRVSVLGESGHFSFQTLLEMESMAGRASMGIPAGKQLAAHLIRKSGIVHPIFQDGGWVWKRESG